MKIRLIWFGRTKERYIDEGIARYVALLRPFADVSISVIKEEKGSTPERTREREGERIRGIKTPYILLDERGKTMTSNEFASYLQQRGPAVSFVLGGAFGVSEPVRSAAQDVISLSRMTLTHEMSRLVFMEQLYRAFTIIHHRAYHH